MDLFTTFCRHSHTGTKLSVTDVNCRVVLFYIAHLSVVCNQLLAVYFISNNSSVTFTFLAVVETHSTNIKRLCDILSWVGLTDGWRLWVSDCHFKLSFGLWTGNGNTV